jgi:hypothetical protein
MTKVRSRTAPEYLPVFDYLITHPGRRLTNKPIAEETGWELCFAKKAKMNLFGICRKLGADRRRVAFDERRILKRTNYDPEPRDRIIGLSSLLNCPGS